MEHNVFIGLGTNLGDREAMLRGAVTALREASAIELTAFSSIYESNPLSGGPLDQPCFLNAVVALQTSMEPRALLNILKGIEMRFGRTASAVRWASRTLDLDILAYDELITDSPELTLPHPELHRRDFVLRPLSEVAPKEWRHPILQKSVGELLAEIVNPTHLRPFSTFP